MINSVAISGSRNIADNQVFNKLKEKIQYFIIKYNNIKFNVGDAKGVDYISQKILSDLKYENVTVWHVKNNLRHIVNSNWKTKPINYKQYSTRYTERDIQMLNVSDYLISVWNGKSRGTKRNIDTFNKPQLVLQPENKMPIQLKERYEPTLNIRPEHIVTKINEVDKNSHIWAYIHDLPYERFGNKFLCNFNTYNDERVSNFFKRINKKWLYGYAIKFPRGSENDLKANGFGTNIYSVSSCNYVLEAHVNGMRYRFYIERDSIIKYPTNLVYREFCHELSEKMTLYLI